MANLDLDDELEGLNDPGVEHLPEHPVMQTRQQANDMFGNIAESPVGRATSPPMWRQAAMFPNAIQHRVWKLIQGQPSGLGVIAATATEEDLIHEFFGAMPKKGEVQARFVLRPLDQSNREIGQEFNVVINEDHAYLQQRLRAMAGEDEDDDDLPIVDPGPTHQEQFTMYMLRQAEAARLKAEQDREDDRRRLAEREAQLAQERVDLAQGTTNMVQQVTERMMEADRVRAQEMLDRLKLDGTSQVNMLSGFFTSQIEAQREERRAERERQEDERKRARETHEQEMARLRLEAKEREEERRQRLVEERTDAQRRAEADRTAWEQRMKERDLDEKMRREALQEEMKAREASRDREHQLRMKEMELSAQRDREHAERMMSLSAQKAGGGFMEIIKTTTAALAAFGVDPKELVGMVRGGGGEWITLLEKVVDKVGEGAITALEMKGDRMRDEEDREEIPLLVDHEVRVERPAPRPRVQQAPPLARTAPAQAQPNPAPAATPTASGALPLAAQKAARAAVSDLVATLQATDPAEWAQKIVDAANAEPNLVPFLYQHTATRAFREAGAGDEQVADILKVLNSIPNAERPFA